MALAQHWRVRLEDDRVIAPTTEARRRIGRCMLAVGRDFGLLAGRCADTHGHGIFVTDQARAREGCRRFEIAVAHALRLPVRFVRAWTKPIDGQGYLTSAFWCVLRQERHHGIDVDPWHDAGTLADLLGARIAGGDYLAARVQAYLPRITTAELWAEMAHGLEGELAREPLHLPFVADAAAAAFGLADLRGQTAVVVRARTAAVQLLAEHVDAARLAEALRMSSRSARRLALAKPDPAARRAVRWQLALRSARARTRSRVDDLFNASFGRAHAT
jgi:hypothetical protein